MFYLERLPCPVLVTDCTGLTLHSNCDFKHLVSPSDDGNINDYLTPACRIFLQTHAWPLLLKNGEFNEIYLQVVTKDQHVIPVMTNARISEVDGKRIVIWLFFVAKERQRFEAELLKARAYAQEKALQLTEANKALQDAYAKLSQYAAEVQSEAQQFAHLSYTDPLTALGNRRALSAHVDQWLHRSEPLSTGSLLLIDIDHFKQVNDRFGHAEGDRVLCELAAHLRASARAQDTVARYGGEEFAIWLPHSDRTGAESIAKRVHACVSNVKVAEREITVSIGIASQIKKTPLTDEYLKNLVNDADTALYEAKVKGRNRTIFYAELSKSISKQHSDNTTKH